MLRLLTAFSNAAEQLTKAMANGDYASMHGNDGNDNDIYLHAKPMTKTTPIQHKSTNNIKRTIGNGKI
eukprot:6207195-Amphidinium_carterae.1